MGPLSPTLAAFIEDIRTRWGVPAISVSLVTGQSQGFGTPTSGPMTPDTVTLIGSNTKLFTCVAIGILVDQGKLTFDTKIKDLIPGFTLENEHTTEYVTVADALSHSTGCASCNMLYAYQNNDCPKDILDNICSTRCGHELRRNFTYDNRWFGVAAYIIEQLSSQTYREFVKSHILIPLGMTTSTFDSKEAEPYVATPSVTLDDGKTMQDLPFWCHKVKPGSAIEAAGFLFSTANDMIKWLKYLMRTMKNENDLNDPKIISFKTLRELIKPRIITSLQTLFSTSERGQPAYPEFSTPLYGLGVQRWHLHGVDVVCHTGGIMGYGSITLWTPDREFGIAVLTNQAYRARAVINIIALRAFEEHFGIEHVDWEARTLARPDMWTTGPFKSPKMIYYGNPVINITDLRGTYSIKGYRNLHIVNVEDKEDVIPIEVIKLRDHFLKSGATVFGKLSGSGGDNIKTVAIWDSTEMLENNFAILHHIGENVYLVEWIQLFEAYRAFPAVLASERVIYGSSGSLLYAYAEANGTQHLEFKKSTGDEVPKIALGEGDFTCTRVQSF